MTKHRLHQILGILLLPYMELEFNQPKKDPIEDIRYRFSELLKRDKVSNRRLSGNYKKSERDLVVFLQKRKELVPDTLDDFEMILNLYFPEKEISQIYALYGKGDEKYDRHLIEKYYLHNIYRIAKSLLTFRDGKIAIRTWVNPKNGEERDIFDYPSVFDKVEVWNQLGRMIVPDILIVAFFRMAGLNQPEHLHGQNGIIWMSDKVLEKILQKGIAETHVHMNACIEYEIYWSKLVDLRRWDNACHDEKEYQEIVKKDRQEYFAAAVFRLIAAEFTISGFAAGRCSFGKFIHDKGCVEIMERLYNGKDVGYWYGLRKIYEQLLEEDKSDAEEVGKNDLLFRTIYRDQRNIRTYPEMIFLQQCMNYLDTDGRGDWYFQHLFFQYMRLKNHFFQNIVQGDRIQGLSNFRLYYNEMTRDEKIYMEERKLDALFKSTSNSRYLQKLELRTVPGSGFVPSEEKYKKFGSFQIDLKNSILTDISAILSKYKEHILLELNMKISKDKKYLCKKNMLVIDQYALQENKIIPTIGIIFHFLKRNYVDNRIADSCWLKKVGYANTFLVQQEQMMECAKAIEELRSTIPLLAEYIVGIDAASEENKVEPWIFAPIFEAARNKKITKPFLPTDFPRYKEVQNIGFTYHVGEEFRHILSGFRHVDEVMQHFGYHAGDRIGHAIALGTDVEKWVARNEVVVLPIMEYMEDLLWLWGIIVHNEVSYEVSLDIVEGRILDLAKEVYGEIIGITPDMLYDAYESKFHHHTKDYFEKMEKLTVDEADSDNRHFCKYYDKKHPYGFTWTADKLLCTQFCPLFYQRFQKPIMVHVNKTLTGLLKAVQAYVVGKVERMGIYVEVNPTSNLAIGGTDGMHDSHIFRLNSKNLPNSEEHEVLVTVNSDDPTVFNTTSENELAYVYHAMNSRGYGKESVLVWIDKVRQNGMDSSFIREVKPPSRLLAEIDELLQAIDKYKVTGSVR